MALYGARVEYALHTLLNLSFAPPETAPSARDLADFQRLPLAFMRKLLTQLEKAGLVSSTEGLRGGWKLAREPKDVSTLAVTEAVEGRSPLFECREIRAHCALWPENAKPRAATTGVCEIHAVMLQAEAAMRRELAGSTLAAIIDKVKAKRSAAAATAVPEWFAERFADRRKA